MRYALLALLLFAAGIAAGMLHPAPDYAPVARVRSPDGLFITLVQPRSARRSACAKVLERFEAALARSCPGCALESADCASRLEGLDRSLAAGEPVPIFTILAGPLRVGLLGPPASVRAECEAMASEFARGGIAGAACVPPPDPGSS